MPDMSGASAIGSMGMQFFGDLTNAQEQNYQNQQSRQFSEKMYDKQKTDMYSFWNMQNEYNSPQAQMKRFQAAGLNPNLIYGQGNSGNAGPMSTPDVQPVSFRAPQVHSADPLAALNAIADLKIKQAQADNLKAQNTVIMQDALLRQTQVETGRFDLGLRNDLREVSGDYKREQLRQLQNAISQATNEDARRTVINSANVDQIMEQIRKSRAERGLIKSQTFNTDLQSFNTQSAREGMDLENQLRKMDIELRKQGVMPHDPLWQRMLGKIITDAGVFGSH